VRKINNHSATLAAPAQELAQSGRDDRRSCPQNRSSFTSSATTVRLDGSFARPSREVDPANRAAVILTNQVGDALSREQQFSSRQRRFAVN